MIGVKMAFLNRSLLLLLAFLFLLAGCEGSLESPARRIAHAGGGIDGETYTDSFEAMDKSMKAGFTLLEIDFSWTSDGELVCLHDWQDSFKRFFGYYPATRPTLLDFKRLVKQRSPYHLCTLDELADWMVENPRMLLVTDVKNQNIRALKLIAKSIEGFDDRVIPQIYQPQSFRVAKEIGYKDIIWTLYRYRGNSEEVLSWVEKMSALYAVTMPTGLAETGLGSALQERGIYTYTHTINAADKLEHYRGLGIDNVYTDFLPPK